VRTTYIINGGEGRFSFFLYLSGFDRFIGGLFVVYNHFVAEISLVTLSNMTTGIP
jgi:hypothetical protein